MPALLADVLHQIPKPEPSVNVRLVRLDGKEGAQIESALAEDDAALVEQVCTAAGFCNLSEIQDWTEWWPRVVEFNKAKVERGWSLGFYPPYDSYQSKRLEKAIDERAFREELTKAIESGAIAQRLSNGTVLAGLIRAQNTFVSRADLVSFCSSVLIEVKDKDARPVFDIPVRPLKVPDALLALPGDSEVRHNDAPRAGWSGSGACKASELIKSIREVIERQGAGRFTLREAAQIVADEHGIDAKWLLKRMTTAIDSPNPGDRLKAYGADTRVARLPGEVVARIADYVKAPEFNAWLGTVADGLDLPWLEPAHARQIETTSFTLTVAEAQELLRARSGQEWPLNKLIGAGVKLAVWLEPSAEHPELFAAFPAGFAAPIIEGGDLQRLAFTRDSGTLTITEHPTRGLLRMSPPASFEANAVRVSQESLEALAGHHEPPTQVTPSGAGAKWEGWKLLDEIAVLLSKAERPDEPYPEVLSIQRRWHDNIAAAVAAGELNIFDAGFIQGRKVRADEMPRALNWCRVSVAALDKWLAGMDSIYRLLASPGQPEQEAQAAPDDRDGDEGKRRLDRLRSLGGKVSRKQGHWRFAGIKKLIDAEKADNRGRTSDKTIREDLCKAADAEADQKRAGLLTQQLVAGGSR